MHHICDYIWYETTSFPTQPEHHIRVLVIAYNKSTNQSVVITAFYSGHDWHCAALEENKIEWHILDPSWEITHWALKTVPEEIDKVNIAKKITEF